MAKLIATRSVLYLNRLYQPGEELPQNDPVRAAAWLEAGSAVREREQPQPKALPAADKSKKQVTRK